MKDGRARFIICSVDICLVITQHISHKFCITLEDALKQC
jgi:hypothetical protein